MTKSSINRLNYNNPFISRCLLIKYVEISINGTTGNCHAEYAEYAEYAENAASSSFLALSMLCRAVKYQKRNLKTLNTTYLKTSNTTYLKTSNTTYLKTLNTTYLKSSSTTYLKTLNTTYLSFLVKVEGFFEYSKIH